MTDAITVRGLSRRYAGADRPAVDGVDLDVTLGEVLCLLGPNGAGKTTTVEILESHRHRDGGQVRVLETDPRRAGRRWRAPIRIVAQNSTDLGELTPAEVLHHLAGYYPNPRDPDQVLQVVGVRPAGRRNSGGCCVCWPPRTRPACSPPHYLDEAEALAGRLGVIVEGRIVAEGTPPMPTAAYVIGKIVLVTTVAQTVLMLTAAVALFDLTLPGTMSRWATFGWVFAPGVVSSSLLDIAISTLARNARSATAIVQLPYLALLFASGVFVNPSPPCWPGWSRSCRCSRSDGWRMASGRCSCPRSWCGSTSRARGSSTGWHWCSGRGASQAWRCASPCRSWVGDADDL